MQASEEEKAANGLLVALGTVTLAAMHATHNPALILQIVTTAIEIVLTGEEENAPATNDRGGD